MNKNGYNMDIADVRCEVPPAETLGELLAAGLARAGFEIVDPATAPDAVRIEGTLEQYFVEPRVGFLSTTPETDIAIALRVTLADGLVAARRFYVKGIESSLLVGKSTFQSSADTAAKMIVSQMVSAIADVLDRYPHLGRSGGEPVALGSSTQRSSR